MPYYKHLLFIIQHFLLSGHIPIIVDDDVVKFTREIVRIQSYTGEEKELVSGFARYRRPNSGRICGGYIQTLLSRPQNRYLVGFQLAIVGDQCESFRNCLCDQHSIERITVVWR